MFNILRLAELLSLNLEMPTEKVLRYLAKELLAELKEDAERIDQQKVTSILAEVRTQIYLGTTSNGSDGTRKATKGQLETLNGLVHPHLENVKRRAEDDDDDDDDEGGVGTRKKKFCRHDL